MTLRQAGMKLHERQGYGFLSVWLVNFGFCRQSLTDPATGAGIMEEAGHGLQIFFDMRV